jgi:Putative RNA methylase family UPF0020
MLCATVAQYALLILPSANRVYGEASIGLSRAELELFGAALGDRLADLESLQLGGVPYLGFSAERLTDGDLAALGNLSCRYALFERDGDLLRPVAAPRLDRYDNDLITIPKYPGKTNELFTKLLLNVTLLGSAFAGELTSRRFRVLDPFCGRGTTLNQALMYGFDAAGMELDVRDVEQYSTYLSTWLKRKRVKHSHDFAPVRRHKRVVARRLAVSCAPSKADHDAGRVQQLEVIAADATRAPEFFRADSFDLIVTDAPYGIQHGSRTSAKTPSRNPIELISTAVPGWLPLLRKGGAIGLAWNLHVAPREQLVAALTSAGLTVLDDDAHRGFAHRVDQAIRRDLVVARKD